MAPRALTLRCRRCVGVLDIDGNVRLQLAHQALAQLAEVTSFAFLADERAVVDAELHLEGRRVDLGEGRAWPAFVGGQRVTDVYISKPERPRCSGEACRSRGARR